jgi:predicted protein tyrosine phosphatase
LTQFYRSKGILTVFNSSVSDINEDEYCSDAFNAAVRLNDLVNIQKNNVFLHCTSGISRASTVFLCYLALFPRFDNWRKNNDIEELKKYLFTHFTAASPNIDIVEKVIK